MRHSKIASIPLRPGLLRRNGDALIDGYGIMSANLRSNAVFQRSDDFSSGGVVFRVRAEHQRHVKRKTNGITLNLNVALLHDVEQPHLNLSRKIGKFVDGEYAPVRAGQKAIVHGELAAEFMAASRRFNGIDVSD